MTTHIVVYEDYTPEVFASLKAVAARFASYYLDSDGTTPVTLPALRKLMKDGRTAKLYPKGADDWAYKVFAA